MKTDQILKVKILGVQIWLKSYGESVYQFLKYIHTLQQLEYIVNTYILLTVPCCSWMYQLVCFILYGGLKLAYIITFGI